MTPVERARVASLQDLVDVEELAAIQESFSTCLGISSVILSPEGKRLTDFSNPTAFCKLIGSTDVGKRRCKWSLEEMAGHALSHREPRLFYCFAYGAHYVAPVVVDGLHVATMFAGQFVPREFSQSQLRDLARIALQIHVEPDRLLEEAKRMRVVEQERCRRIAGLFFQIVDIIALLGSQAAELRRTKAALQQVNVELQSRVEERTAELARSLEDLKAEAKERERAESEVLQYAGKVEESNKELEQFAYVASHDLQEPLRAISGYLQLLQSRYADQIDANAARYIENAVSGADRMRTLIQDLLTYSRVTTHPHPAEPVDCAKLLDQALGDLGAAVEEQGAKVTHDEMPTVMADGTQLGQLLVNLIGNAIKFCDDAPPEVHVGAQRQGDEWRFSVRDNGIGIAPEDMERVFLIFKRLHTRQEYPGTGIGLAVCKKIVDRHSGRIWVESEPGKGATFFFTIPSA